MHSLYKCFALLLSPFAPIGSKKYHSLSPSPFLSHLYLFSPSHFHHFLLGIQGCRKSLRNETSCRCSICLMILQSKIITTEEMLELFLAYEVGGACQCWSLEGIIHTQVTYEPYIHALSIRMLKRFGSLEQFLMVLSHHWPG